MPALLPSGRPVPPFKPPGLFARTTGLLAPSAAAAVESQVEQLLSNGDDIDGLDDDEDEFDDDDDEEEWDEDYDVDENEDDTAAASAAAAATPLPVVNKFIFLKLFLMF